MSKNTTKLSEYCLLILLFSVLCIFFCIIHPHAVFDYDDWSYISGFRLPVPLPNYWNPSRVLPECLMPLCGFIGSIFYHLFPSVGYLRSISNVVGVVLSLFVSAYIFSYYYLVRKKFNLSFLKSAIITAVVFSLHFVIFKKSEKYNSYLFCTTNMTCCFFYLIPALLNSSVVLILIANNNFPYFFRNLSVAKVMLMCVLYFSVFSNMFGSIILASYLVCSIIIEFVCRRNIKLKEFIKCEALSFTLIILWGAGCILESFGGRARMTSDGNAALFNFQNMTFPELSQLYGRFSRLFIIVSISVLIIFAVILIIRKFNVKELYLLGVIISSLAVCTVLIFLLCAKVDYTYFKRSEVIFSVCFYLILILAFSMSIICKYTKQGELIIVCILALLIPNCNIFNKNEYTESVCTFSDSNSCISLSQDIVDQVVSAEKNNEKDVAVKVIQSFGDTGSNWPQTFNIGEKISKTLIKHNIISNEMNITVIPDGAINEKYDIYFH